MNGTCSGIGRPPRIVAVGGGHGLAATLRSVRRLSPDVTAVVSVADDGGSSGRLRAASEVPAPGDLRKCLVALSDSDSTLARSLGYRFRGGELDGHALGNLLLVAMSEADDLVGALDDLGRLLELRGRVLPATDQPVHLVATTSDGEVRGQVAVSQTDGIETVAVDPEDAVACPEAVEAITAADVILLGPGSLFTSVLAAVVVPGVTEAILGSAAPLVYICNLQPQDHETTGYDVAAHVAALARHGLTPDVVLYDPDRIGPAVGVRDAVPVRVASPSGLTHDDDLLSAALAPYCVASAR